MTDMNLVRSDATLCATVTGAGPTILLLHAGGERRGVWVPVATRLAGKRLRTVAYDLRGHGDSTGRATTLRVLADDVTEMVGREPTPIVVVGASVGGLAALAALADPPTAQRVAGLVLVDAVPQPDPRRVSSWLDDRGLRDHHTALVRDVLASGPELAAVAEALELPILVVRAGSRSPLTDADADRLRAANHRVAVIRVAGAGHLVARDAPAELARIVAVHASTWLGTDDVVRRAFEFQRELGAERIDHPGGTLYAHVSRVHALAAGWGATPRTRLASICHATYGTDGFRHALLPATARRRLQHVIGLDAEALVHLYGACDRSRTYPGLGRPSLPMVDRFTGRSSAIRGADLRDFAVLTIANELDVARHAHPPAAVVEEIRTLVAALADYAPEEAAYALADESLG